MHGALAKVPPPFAFSLSCYFTTWNLKGIVGTLYLYLYLLIYTTTTVQMQILFFLCEK